jgi:hypothetical protein
MIARPAPATRRAALSEDRAMSPAPVTFARKLLRHLTLLRRDPERFGANLMQITNPPLFHERLLDIERPAPLQVALAPRQDQPPALHILTGPLRPENMTGGPNTVLRLALAVAAQGVPVQLVVTQPGPPPDAAWLRRHTASLTGHADPPPVAIATATDRDVLLRVGLSDAFMATHWTTAQQLKPLLPRLACPSFFYLIQDFEPGFYAWSSNHALALETYGLPHRPVFNQALLAAHFAATGLHGVADPVVFEPAVDATVFHPPADVAPRPRRLLFYARPSNPRNMFGLGVTALERVAADPAFDGWELLSVGSRGSVPTLSLPGGRLLRPAAWLDYAGYAGSLRAADILLAPMLSPHTGYPALEMAATGGLAVTNSFATKTPEMLVRLSDNLIAVPPTAEGFAAGLFEAARRVNAGRARIASLRVPHDWDLALAPAAAEIAASFGEMISAG